MNTRHVLAAMICLLLLTATSLHAQTATGQVNGTVTDASGGAVVGAKVRLVNEGTNVVTQTETNANGYYLFLNVQPGSYGLSVEMASFKTARLSALEITVNQAITQNVRLDLGATSDSVTVTAESPLLQQSSSELGSVIAEKAVQELPLNGRNFTQLMILTPGANPVSTSQGSGISFEDGADRYSGERPLQTSLHGQQNRSVLFLLDGIINTDFRGSITGRCRSSTRSRIQGAIP